MRYLGVTTYLNLTWNQHLESTTIKAVKSLMISRRLRGKKWGKKLDMLYWINNMVLKPMLSYAALVWSQGTTKQRNSPAKHYANTCLSRYKGNNAVHTNFSHESTSVSVANSPYDSAAGSIQAAGDNGSERRHIRNKNGSQA